MRLIKTQYTKSRDWVFSKSWWKRFYKFAQLPELKFMKTLGFIASWLL